MPSTIELRKELRRQATHVVSGFASPSPAEEFRRMAQWCDQHDLEHDTYGEGALIEEFEQKIAQLLGMEAGAFMPSGMMAQLIAMRLHCAQAGVDRIGLHPTSHLLHHEEQSFACLMQLKAIPVGERHRPILASDLGAIHERLGCLTSELPIREAGGQLPSWDELEELKSLARSRGVALHMDGARLWESAPYYEKSYAEIAAGFDSVYVSMYKGIGGIAGAVLCGRTAWIAEARLWRRRLGGTLIHQSPMVISAAHRFDERIALMGPCWRRAQQLAAALNGVPGLKTLPTVPQTSMFHLYLARPAEDVLSIRDAIAREHGIWLLGWASNADVPGWSVTEISVGDRLLSMADEELTPHFARLVDGSS